MSRPALGILGVGYLASHLVPRLAAGGTRPIRLSPRNAERAAALAAGHANVSVARDNHTLVTECEVVLLATRPHHAVAAIERLPWRPDHTLISLCAGLPLDALMFNAGAAALARAMPTTAAAIGESPTCLYPDLAVARELLQSLGPVHVLDEEGQFEVATVSAALYGWVHALISEMALWSVQQGLPPALARALVSETVRAAGAMVQADPERSLPDLVQPLCTPGGITELGLQTLQDVRAFDYWQRAAQAVLDRLREQGDELQ